MSEVTIIGIDLAKRVFQLHGACPDGSIAFRTRQMFVGQRTQLINALRGHLAEHGLVAARGPAHLKRFADAIADNDTTLPKSVRELGR